MTQDLHSILVGNNITDASHDLIISVGNNIMYLFIVHQDTFFYSNGKYFIIKYLP